MATKKYINLNNLSTFLTVLRETFSPISHSHKMADIEDYVVDTALSSTSVNPVQNKIIDAEFEAVSNAMGALENAIDSKSDSTHTHDDRYYTESEIDSKLSAKSDSTHNHDNNYLTKEDPSAIGSFSLNRKESTSIGTYSVAEGRNNTASGLASHAEGDGTTASAQAAHAEGSGTTASSWYTHAEGWDTTASARAAHAEGNTTVAKGQQSHAEGFYTVAASTSQHVQGKHNIEDANDVYAHIVGNGSSDAKSNAHTLDWDGNAWYAGTIKVGGTSYEDAVEVATKNHEHAVIIETNKNLEQKFWRGTQAEYDAIEVKDDATMYIVIDGEDAVIGGSGGVGSLEELGVFASAEELNYVDGVTSNIQEQLDEKLSLSDLGDVAYVGDEEAINATAPLDANTLGGKLENMLSVAKAVDSDTLSGKAPEYYIQPRNLLDNSDFTNPVNHRGATSCTGAWSYFIDRWVAENATVTIGDAGVTITNGYLTQRVPRDKINANSVYTLAACDEGGIIYVGSNAGDVLGVEDTSYDFATIKLKSGRTYVWAALYEGEYTAETLPPYIPKGYGAELAECQRYYVQLTQNIPMVCISATDKKLRGTLISPRTLRVYPSVSWHSINWVYMSGYDTSTSGNTALKVNARYGNGVDIVVTLPSNISPTLNSTYLVAVDVRLSADL